jgi:uncharacterized lipoprotein YehR (DUF1307 family)
MRFERNFWFGKLAVLLLAVGLSACGGGGGESSSSSALETAGTSVTAFVTYINSLVLDDEAREPIDVNALVPPTDDEAEPTNI